MLLLRLLCCLCFVLFFTFPTLCVVFRILFSCVCGGLLDDTSTKSVSFALVLFQLRPSLPPSMTVLPPQGALNSMTKQATTARCHTTTTNPFVDLSLASIMTPGHYTALNAPSETSSSKTWTRLCTIGTPTSTTWIASPSLGHGSHPSAPHSAPHRRQCMYTMHCRFRMGRR